MGNCCKLDDTLFYTTPSHGDWGLVRICSLVPESHMLFICPFACGRHGALGAIQQGFGDKVSYIYIKEKDIIEGYDQTILNGVEALLKRIRKRPKAIMIYVSCLDDLIGTDIESIVDTLNDTYQDVVFAEGHMNPISLDSKTPPPVTTQDAMFGCLHRNDSKTDSVNMIGNFVKVDENSEIFSVLEHYGLPEVRHIADFDTFDGFQSMAQSKYNIMLSPIASLAAVNMQQKHNIPFIFLPVSYSMQSVSNDYNRLIDSIRKDKASYNFEHDIEKTKNEIKETLNEIGDTPIAISTGGVLRPFSLAKDLLEYGFNVNAVVCPKILPIDQESCDWVLENKKDMKVIQPQHHDIVKFEHINKECIAIGFDACYITGTSYLADVVNDETMFGYHGIRKMMRSIANAVKTEVDLQQKILDYGLVI